MKNSCALNKCNQFVNVYLLFRSVPPDWTLPAEAFQPRLDLIQNYSTEGDGIYHADLDEEPAVDDASGMKFSCRDWRR